MVTINIPKEEFENLKCLMGKRELSDDDINLLKLIIQKVGVTLSLKEYVAIRYDDGFEILCPGMTITINIDVYEGSIILNFRVENSVDYKVLTIEAFPERSDELVEALEKMKRKGGGFS